MAHLWILSRTLILFFVTIENTLSYTIFKEAFELSDYLENCTLKPHLPCEATIIGENCQPFALVPVGWPGAPSYTSVGYDMVPKSPGSLECLARLNITWTIPNDDSAYALTGMWISVMSISGMTNRLSMCVTYNLTAAHWNYEDIQDMVSYSYTGVLVHQGDFSINFNSLPLPPFGQKDNTVEVYSTIPFMYLDESGQCQTRKEKTMSTPPVTPGPVMPPVSTWHQPPGPEWTFNKKMRVGVSAGCVVGVLLLGVFIGVLCYSCKKGSKRNTFPSQPKGNEQGEVGSLLQNENLENMSDIGECRPSSIAQHPFDAYVAVDSIPYGACVDRQNTHQTPDGLMPDFMNAGPPPFVPYTKPEDIGTDISECVAEIHRSQPGYSNLRGQSHRQPSNYRNFVA